MYGSIRLKIFKMKVLLIIRKFLFNLNLGPLPKIDFTLPENTNHLQDKYQQRLPKAELIQDHFSRDKSSLYRLQSCLTVEQINLRVYRQLVCKNLQKVPVWGCVSWEVPVEGSASQEIYSKNLTFGRSIFNVTTRQNDHDHIGAHN